MSELKKDNRIWYFDFLRIAACIAVIVLHVSAKKYESVDVGSYPWFVFNIYNSLSRWGVPVFVMISGALFLDPEKQLDLKKLYSVNFVRIVTAFLFWSAFYAAVDYITGTRLRTVVFNFMSGGVHLWFLYMIAGLYLIVPLVRRITESKKHTVYFLVLALVFTVVFYTSKSLISYVDSRFAGSLDVVSNELSMKFVCGYTGYFILGHFLHRYEISKKIRGVIYTLGIFGYAATVLMTYVFSKKANGLDPVFLDSFSAGVMLEAVAVFVFFKYHTPELKNIKIQKLILQVSKCSFGIYLVHFIIQRYSREIFHVSPLKYNPIITVPLISGGVFVVSLIISYILNKIPIVKKYIV